MRWLVLGLFGLFAIPSQAGWWQSLQDLRLKSGLLMLALSIIHKREGLWGIQRVLNF